MFEITCVLMYLMSYRTEPLYIPGSKQILTRFIINLLIHVEGNTCFFNHIHICHLTVVL